MTAFYQPGDFERLVPTKANEDYRTPFRRDFARIIHSPAWRRLQRKTQLFPGDESDFFRNRLTHSLEVAQIAKSIAIRLNSIIRSRHRTRFGFIDVDCVELAAMAHDLGHPPFGHTGEHALHQCMFETGGFEGNAQTLRILSRLEKRQTLLSSDLPNFTEFYQGSDRRAGLNLCFRSLAAVLKYDNCIPIIGQKPLTKGYYASETDLVEKVKRGVLGHAFKARQDQRFEVVEMQIMDLADDIAYSTYDFEDALKAGFASPMSLLQQLNSSDAIKTSVSKKLFKSKFRREFIEPASPDDEAAFADIQGGVVASILLMLRAFWQEIDHYSNNGDRKALTGKDRTRRELAYATIAVKSQQLSDDLVQNGYIRSEFTSELVARRLSEIDIEVDKEVPALSRIQISEDARFDIDVLKHLTYELHIKSPRLKLIEYRGNQIVTDLFECFNEDEAGDLLPIDWRDRLKEVAGFPSMRRRLTCDYIAGMTDAYALDIYARLKTTNPAALFRPF